MPKANFTSMPIGDMSPNPLDRLSVSIDYSASQPASSGAITFALIIDNDTTESIELINPYDVITYTLTNEAGWPITSDAPASRLVVNAAEPFVNNKDEYLHITKLISGDSVLSIEDEVKKDKIVISAKSGYHYILQITTMVPHSGQPDDAKKHKKNLTEGKFGITLTLPLILVVGNQEYSRILQSPSVEINLSNNG